MDYYNDFDRHSCAWLRELIKAGLIAEGKVDERSIAEIQPGDLGGFRQVHLFAGIGGWPYALQLAGWDPARPVWTGSCPCQPFSQAGKRKATADSRHLWPEMRRLISECKPATVFGEQVASRLGRDWLAGIRFDLEELGYAVGAADLCAACIGAPHIRQRLFWVANAGHVGPGSGHGAAGGLEKAKRSQQGEYASEDGTHGGMANTCSQRQQNPGGASCDETTDGRAGRHRGESNGDYLAGGSSADGSRMAKPDGREQGDGQLQRSGQHGQQQKNVCPSVRLGSPNRTGLQVRERQELPRAQRHKEGGAAPQPGGALDTFWSDYVLIPCQDGKARRSEPGIFPLAHGIPGRVGLLRGYGNAIVPQIAAAFVKAFLDAELGINGRENHG